MAIGLGSVREARGLEPSDRAVRRLESEWQRGRPDLGALWGEHARDATVSVLAAMVKADLAQRFARGERPEVNEYLGRFPELRGDGERVLSLVYEEYCLREERGERPDTEEFCVRYAEWRDSLESQLKYHRVISRVAGSAPPPPRYPAEGEQFGQFRIGSELGRGGSARVYLVRDESLGGREAVLKVSADRGNEPAILGRLVHPHIVTVHGVATQAETNLRGLCMPFRPGLPLDEVIRRLGPGPRPAKARALWDVLVAPEPAPAAPAGARPGGVGWHGFPARGSFADGVAWVLATLADALAYAHSEQIYHRDVKPANVLLTYSDGPQLLDFNLSHDPHSAEQAAAALRGGTLPYMAPEQLEAFLDPARWGGVVAQADVYSLGLLARELLTGREPETPDPSLPLARALRALLDRRSALDTRLRRDDRRIPHALEAIVGRCLAYHPEGRYRASELAEDLRLFLARRPLRYAPNRSTRELAANWSFRNRTRLAVAAGVVTCMALASPFAAKRLDRWLHAPETRPAFLKAVDDLKRDKPDDAVADLDRLYEEDSRSPLVGFYRAAAFCQQGRYTDAYEVYRRACDSPGAELALSDWGHAHPGFALEAERLGGRLLHNKLISNADRRAGALEGSGRLVRLALALEPGRKLARQTLALIDEIEGNYASARRRLSELVEELGPGAETDDEKRTHLKNLLQQRGRTSYVWGAKLQTTGAGRPDRPGADARFNDALADLVRAGRLVKEEDYAGRFDLAFIHGEILLAQGQAAVATDRAKALRLYRQAEGLLAPFRAHSPGARNEESLKILAAKVKQRIESVTPAPGGSPAR